MSGEKLAADTSAGFGIEAVGGIDPGQGLINTIVILVARVLYEVWTERRRRKREKRERDASVTKSPAEQ